MPNLPLRPNLSSYRGAKENLRRKNLEKNALAHRIAYYVNRLIANDPTELQQYIFATIAMDIDVATDDVRSAISDGGYNGITIRVTERDRKMLEQFRDK